MTKCICTAFTVTSHQLKTRVTRARSSRRTTSQSAHRHAIGASRSVSHHGRPPTPSFFSRYPAWHFRNPNVAPCSRSDQHGRTSRYGDQDRCQSHPMLPLGLFDPTNTTNKITHLSQGKTTHHRENQDSLMVLDLSFQCT